MSNFREIKVNEIKNNPFEMIGTDWMLITAKRNDKVNTMTASWGGLGVIWNKNVVTVYIRPQRYTKEFIEKVKIIMEIFGLIFLIFSVASIPFIPGSPRSIMTASIRSF